MELFEARAKTHYRHSFDKIPEAASIVEDEIRHEAELIEEFERLEKDLN